MFQLSVVIGSIVCLPSSRLRVLQFDVERIRRCWTRDNLCDWTRSTPMEIHNEISSDDNVGTRIVRRAALLSIYQTRDEDDKWSQNRSSKFLIRRKNEIDGRAPRRTWMSENWSMSERRAKNEYLPMTYVFSLSLSLRFLSDAFFRT